MTAEEFTVLSRSDFVTVFITSNCNSFTSEKKFAKDLTVTALKGRLEVITGASALSMKIAAYDKKDNMVSAVGNSLPFLFASDKSHRAVGNCFKL